MSRERDTVRATLRELNYLLGLRNALSREAQDLLENPQAARFQEFEETVVQYVMDRLERDRDYSHPPHSLDLDQDVSRVSRPGALQCDACMGIGISPNDGGICRTCEGTGMDLSKRPESPFLSWSQSR